MEEETKTTTTTKEPASFWSWAVASVLFRLLLIYLPADFNLSSRPEVSTPLTSLRRLAEDLMGNLISLYADFATAMLIRGIGSSLQMAYNQGLKTLDIVKQMEGSAALSSGDIAALVYLWNPLTLVACLGSSTSPVDNLIIILTLFGACRRLVPLAAFGWVIATHLSLYPVMLIIPVILLLGYGPDAPPKKLLRQRKVSMSREDSSSGSHVVKKEVERQHGPLVIFLWKPVLQFIMWASLWAFYVLTLCSISVNRYGGLREMFKSTYGFILTIEDLSPNIGVLWYFFAEVFDFFRNFFLIVFHVNILFMILPLAIRLNHRPCFLAFAYIAISSMLKSYPSVGDAALYLGLLCLFVNELSDMQFSFFLFYGYIGVFLLSPVMHNLWIWRGTGNANFYFATAIFYACLQIVLLVESVWAMLNHDRKLRRLSATNTNA